MGDNFNKNVDFKARSFSFKAMAFVNPNRPEKLSDCDLYIDKKIKEVSLMMQ